MFALAVEELVMPAHEDWLNERSSTPPVSSTMQALNSLPAAALEPELLGDALVVDLVPHAARAMAATEATATILIDDLKALSPLCTTSARCTKWRTFVTLPATWRLRPSAYRATPATFYRNFLGPRCRGVSRDGVSLRRPEVAVRRWRPPAHPRPDRPGAGRRSHRPGFWSPTAPSPPAQPAGTRRSPPHPGTARSASVPAAPASGRRRRAACPPTPG